MDRAELAIQYNEAYARRDVPAMLRMMHPQCSYYDAFWGETCSGGDLANYYLSSFAQDQLWYRPDDELVITPNGFVVRYVAFRNGDPEGLVPIFNGAEVITVAENLILTISDFYCDPNPIDLIEVSLLAQDQHSRSHISQLGLGAKTSGRIKRRLDELAESLAIFTDPTLTISKLADLVDCSVMHLFHVLEEELGTTFIRFVRECRARYASDLLASMPAGEIDLPHIADRSGFVSVNDLQSAFHLTFGVSADAYLTKFSN